MKNWKKTTKVTTLYELIDHVRSKWSFWYFFSDICECELDELIRSTYSKFRWQSRSENAFNDHWKKNCVNVKNSERLGKKSA